MHTIATEVKKRGAQKEEILLDPDSPKETTRDARVEAHKKRRARAGRTKNEMKIGAGIWTRRAASAAVG